MIVARDASAELRSHMPVAAKYAYFDHAAVAPLPQVAASAIIDYAQQSSQQGDVPWMNWSMLVAATRSVAASMIGAGSEEIALVSSTTHGIGLVAEGFRWQPGENVVVPDNEFPSNLLPWKALQRRGVELRRAPVPPSGELDIDRLVASMDGRTRIVSLSWVGFASGFRVNVAEVAERVHARGGLLMIDAIQGLGAFPIDIGQSNVDFLCADGHKWMLGPEGAGVLYVRRDLLEELEPLGLGWNSLESGGFDPNSSQIKRTAARYEGGSINMPGMMGLGASLKLLQQVAWGSASNHQVSAAILRNVEVLSQKLSGTDFEACLPSNPENRSGIVPIALRGGEPASDDFYMAARKFLLSRDIVLSVRGGRLRVGTHAYNNDDDIDRLVSGLIAFREQS